MTLTSAHAQKLILREGRDGKQRKVAKMVLSDGFEETLRESMTALKLGGLVLKEEQKAALYAVTSKKARLFMYFTYGFWKVPDRKSVV